MNPALEGVLFAIRADLLGFDVALDVTVETLWVAFGFAAQLMFMMRFLVQWIATERAKRSIIPISFWYLSIVGGAMLLTYAIYRQDPVFIVGQATGLLIYLRNLYFLKLEQRETTEAAEAAATAAATRVAERAAAGTPGHGWHGIGAVLALLAVVTLYRVAVLFAADYPLFGDEAQYWSWAQELAFGYYSKPPMVAWAIAGTTALLGDGEAAVRVSAALTYFVSGLFIYLLARRLYDARVAAWSAAVFITLPAVSLSSGVISTDPFLLMFWAVSLYAVHRAVSEDAFAWWLTGGLAVGLGLLSKYTMVAFAGSLLLYLLLDPEARRQLRRPGFYAALVLAGLLVAPNVLWNAEHGFATLAHTSDNMNLDGPLFRPEKMLEFLGSQFGVFGPILFGALLVLLVRRLRTLWAEPGARYLLAFVLPLLLAILGQSLLSRAHANWAAAVYVPAAILVTVMLLRAGYKALLYGSIALHVVAALLMYHYDGIVRLAGVELTAKTDPLYNRMRGWDRLGEAVGRLVDAHPDLLLLSDDRMLHAELLYYLRGRTFVAVKWNYDGHVGDHYELTTNPADWVGRDFLYISESPQPPRRMAAAFEAWQDLGEIVVSRYGDGATDRNSVIRVHAFRMQRLKAGP